MPIDTRLSKQVGGCLGTVRDAAQGLCERDVTSGGLLQMSPRPGAVGNLMGFLLGED